MQQKDFLVVGLGIAGIMTSFELWKQGRSFWVIDNPAPPKSSLVAGAVINPINVHQWKEVTHNAYIPAALDAYTQLEKLLHCAILKPTPILIQPRLQHPDQQPRVNALSSSLGSEECQLFETSFTSNTVFRKITNAWQVDAQTLYTSWRLWLQQNNLLLQEKLDHNNLVVQKDKVLYKEYVAEKIIFCEGAAAAQNPLLSQLPFTRNRGEALLLSIPRLDPRFIYQHELRLVPAGNSQFWCGSNYIWLYNHLLPDENWRKQTQAALSHWLRLPFTVINHIVAERPTTAGQLLLAGKHPALPSVAILTGLGTKGFSVAPLLSQWLIENVLNSSSNSLPQLTPLTKWIKP